jgi:hypothetical protein
VSLHAGGGWPQPKGYGYFKFSQSVLRATDYFSPSGDVLPITTTTFYTSHLYGEFGFTDRLTGLLSAPLFVRSTINHRESTINGAREEGDAFNGVGDIQLGLKYGLITNGPVVLSAALWLKLPTGDNVGGNTELLQSGDGAFSQMVLLEASHSFYPSPFYATLSTGYRQRGSTTFDYQGGSDEITYSDEFRWGGEFGWTPGRLSLALKWEQIIPMDNGDQGGELGASSVFGNNIAYFSITPEVNYSVTDKFGVSLAVGTAVSGQNILASPNFMAGVFLKIGE